MWHLWVDLIFYPEISKLRAFQELKKRKGLRARHNSTLGTVLKPFNSHLSLCTASLKKSLCILTSLKHQFWLNPQLTYSCPNDICLLHVPPVIHLHIPPSQCYASLLYLCYLLPMIKSPQKINRVPFFSPVISAPFLKVICT